MIKILGSFKIVPNLDAVQAQEWETAQQHICFDYVKTDWNCFDESALEMILRFSADAEGLGMPMELTALTLGASVADSYLHTLQALGFHRAVRIEQDEQDAFYPERRAAKIAGYVKCQGHQDLVVMGCQSSDEMNGKTPLLTAEYLGWPCVTQVLAMEPRQDQQLLVEQCVDGGTVKRLVQLPCVIAVGNAPCAYLRVPTLKDRLQRGRAPIDMYVPDESALAAALPQARMLGWQPVHETRDGIVIEGDTVEEKVETLYGSYLKGRLK